MLAFDTSSIVYAWDNYPIEQFPTLWEWLGKQLHDREIVLSCVAMEEVSYVSPECHAWLHAVSAHELPMTNAIIQLALEIKTSLGIGNHYGIGVGENDLFIVATAAVNGCDLITNEAVQPDLPQHKPKYKMPAVCAMDGVKVKTTNFIDFLKASKVVF